MKAAVFDRFGGPDVLELREVATPEPKPGEVLVRVLAAGINRLDHYLREGSVTTAIALPHVLGSDAVGVVAALGEGVTGWAEGDRVIPMPGYPTDPAEADLRPVSAAPSYLIRGVVEDGAYAEYMTVPARWLLRDTTGLAPEEAATLPMALTTGVRAARAVGGVGPGQRVLVHAGASGTGSVTVQIAKALGAEVAATVRSAAKIPFVESLGADLVIEAGTEDFVARTRDWTAGAGLDVVIDNLGGEVFARSLDALKPLGTLVSMGMVAGLEARFDLRRFFFAQKRILGTLMGDPEDLAWGLGEVAAGRIRPVLDRALPLAEAAAAHRLIAESAPKGGLVLIP